MEPFGNLIGTSKSQKIKNCLEINFGIVPKKKVRTGLGLNTEPKAFTKVRLAEFRTVDQENLTQP